MSLEESKELLGKIKQSVQNIKEIDGISAIDALIQSLNNMTDPDALNRYISSHADHSAEIEDLLNNYDSGLQLDDFEPNDRQRVLEMMIAGVEQEDNIPAISFITPTAIGLLVEYLFEQYATEEFNVNNVLDLANGSGNLLITVINQIQRNYHHEVHGIAFDNDEKLVRLARLMSKISEDDIDVELSDSLRVGAEPLVDLAVSDLPIGYYPDDENAKNFESASSIDHSFAHHLLIEQSMKMVRSGGYGIFIVPATLFQSNQSQKLANYLVNNVNILGIFDLPDDFFAQTPEKKSILVLQNKGENSFNVKEVLKMSINQDQPIDELGRISAEINVWKKNNS